MNIPKQSIPVIDVQTGAMTYTWYKFFSDLTTALGSSNTPTDDAKLLALVANAK
jgi:hypothetical protein